MTAKQMLKCYKFIRPDATFENMLERSLVLDKLDPISFKYCPFLEDQAQLTEDAWGIFHQCVAIEKGWA